MKAGAACRVTEYVAQAFHDTHCHSIVYVVQLQPLHSMTHSMTHGLSYKITDAATVLSGGSILRCLSWQAITPCTTRTAHNAEGADIQVLLCPIPGFPNPKLGVCNPTQSLTSGRFSRLYSLHARNVQLKLVLHAGPASKRQLTDSTILYGHPNPLQRALVDASNA